MSGSSTDAVSLQGRDVQVELGGGGQQARDVSSEVLGFPNSQHL